MRFIEYYNAKRAEFVDAELFTTITGEAASINWPDASGVYAIWQKVPNEPDELIYIGMTGKFSNENENAVFNKASFKKRNDRYTPYRFCESKIDLEINMRYHFRYGPRENNTQEQYRIKHDLNAYSNSIPYTSLEIHCFHINANHQSYSPALLESELLTKYLKDKGSLPPANNSL